MRYRTLGRSGLAASQISLGTVELGLDYGIPVAGETLRPSAAEAGYLLNTALDRGVNFIDTARAYGESEAIIGRSISRRRAEFILASKVQTFAGQGLSPEARRARMIASAEESLRLLQTDCLDLLLLHTTSLESNEFEACVDVLDEIRRLGYTRFTGASVYGPQPALQAIRSGRIDAVQVAWHLLDRRVEDEVLCAAADHNIGLVVRSVLMRGALTHRRTELPAALEPVRAGASALDRIAAGAGISLPELAYRYVLSQEGPFTALVGTGRLSELEAGIGYSERGALEPSVMEAVRGVTLEDEALLDLSRWPAF